MTLKTDEKHESSTLIDFAALTILGASALYMFGLSYHEAKISALGASSSLFEIDPYLLISQGFLGSFLTIFVNPWGLFISMILLLSGIIFSKKKGFSQKELILFTLILLFVHTMVLFTTGKKMANEVLVEMNSYHKDGNFELNRTKKAIVEYSFPEKGSKTISGLIPSIYGNYILVSKENGIHAIEKTKIISIHYSN